MSNENKTEFNVSLVDEGMKLVITQNDTVKVDQIFGNKEQLVIFAIEILQKFAGAKNESI
jgi:hypothetical protein